MFPWLHLAWLATNRALVSSEGGTWALRAPQTSSELRLGLELVLGVKLRCIQRLYFLLPKGLQIQDGSLSSGTFWTWVLLISLSLYTTAVTQSAARDLPRLLQSSGFVSWEIQSLRSTTWTRWAEWAPQLALTKQGEDAKAGQGLASLLPPAQLVVIQLHSRKRRFWCLLSISFAISPGWGWLGSWGAGPSQGMVASPRGACNLLISGNTRLQVLQRKDWDCLCWRHCHVYSVYGQSV